jgi:hypothetical protein
MKITDENNTNWWQVFPDDDAAAGAAKSGSSFRENLMKLVNSSIFAGIIAVMIVLNGVYVAIDEIFRTSENQFNAAWLVVEFVFTFTFLAEFFLKLGAYKTAFFKDSWNNFDFVLAWLGVLGFGLSCEVQRTGGGKADQAELLRLSRVFRILRFLRVIRLLHSQMGAEKMSVPLANRIHRILTLMCFIHAHLKSELSLVKYFGGNNEVDDPEEVELARCIVQSQTAVYQALAMAVKVEQDMNKELIEELKWVKQRKHVTEGLEAFVMSAHKDGAISAREAEGILHPMHHHIGDCLKEFEKFEMGLEKSLIGGAKSGVGKIVHGLSGKGHGDGGHGDGHGGHGHETSPSVPDGSKNARMDDGPAEKS